MITDGKWILAEGVNQGECPVFVKKFSVDKIEKSVLQLTGKGVYYAQLNGKRIGNFIMAPGYTQYSRRLQYQTYDITDLLQKGDNVLTIFLSAGWYASRKIGFYKDGWTPEIIAELKVGDTVYATDESWLVGSGALVFSEIYDGEIYDARKGIDNLRPVVVTSSTKDILIEQEGEIVEEQERFFTQRIFTTPKGETVIDFGQNMVGYIELTVDAREGEEVNLSFAEVLDKHGNFYTDNYRTAKCVYSYTCRDGKQSYKPLCTFFGFRYIRVNAFPASAVLDENTFTAISVYSKLTRTGSLSCSNPKLNQLFSNVLWGQRSNFLDVPTDCPQRDERLGWTGDAQVFCKTACYNFDTLKFFKKWLNDMKAVQEDTGMVGFTVPGKSEKVAAAWSDASVIIPWQIYKMFGDKEVLESSIDMMTKHIAFIEKESEEKYTWKGGEHLRQFGDWLATDSLDRDRDGSFVNWTYSGLTNPDFLQCAFFAYSTGLVAQALEVLGRDSAYYRDLYAKIKERFQTEFTEYNTQTECIIALWFDLAPNREETLALLCRKIRENGDRMSTGFVGTPYILHALSSEGRFDLAYSLLLQENYPSWLFCVNLGATTMWEHWDGINAEGDMWNVRMNSFNHYAYGAVAEWVYEVSAGITQEKDSAGFEKPIIAPHPDKRLGWLEGKYATKNGEIVSKWTYTQDGLIRYDITVPTTSKIIIDGDEKVVEKGSYTFVKKA